MERLVVLEKTNLAPFPPPAAVAFRLTSAPEDASRAVVNWLDERAGVTPEAMLADRREDRELGEIAAELILASIGEQEEQGVTPDDLEAVRKAHGIGANTWEQERSRLRKAEVIRLEQRGRTDGRRGGGQPVWKPGIRFPEHPHGTEQHGTESEPEIADEDEGLAGPEGSVPCQTETMDPDAGIPPVEVVDDADYARWQELFERPPDEDNDAPGTHPDEPGWSRGT